MSDASGSRLQLLLDAALQSYERQTGMKLIDHPLASQFDNCHSVDSIMDILQQQARAFTEFRGDDGKVMKILRRSVHVLHALSTSTTLGEGIGLPFPPAKVIFAAIGILFTGVKDVNSSYDALVDLLETIEHFLRRLEIHAELPPTAAMGTIMVKIMVELLYTIALVTKQVKQSRPLKLVKKMLGENEVESVLLRLDRLSMDEARTTATQTLEVVHGLIQNVRVVMDDGKASADAIWDALQIMEKILTKINESQRKKLQRQVRKWLSPPDPWKNHNTARESHYSGTSKWFIESNTFGKWRSSGLDSLLWIHGKPGAGKSIICSTIVENIDDMRKRGLASLGFFYCDFGDDDKRNLHGLVSSLLVQLCHHSDSYSAILSEFYSAHDDGSRQASDKSLIGCLRDILKHQGQAPVYIIIDALDECPNTFGMPSPREKVLVFLEGLLGLHLQNLRICITSRLEVDIATALDRLSFRTISLHDEAGQRQDIVNYLKSVVYTDVKMKEWRTEDKELVINELMKGADGMFRWVFCQLEFLRRCLPARIQQALEELPESLNGTYERILQDIDKANWKFAHRIFQCITVASRPLRVEELTEFLAFDFDAGSTPTYRVGWRAANPVGAVLSTCSSLLVVVKIGHSQVIQFSHFSVKEFLMSTRLAETSDTISRYHVSIIPAQTLVAQACLGILLHLDENITNDSLDNFPLAEYAAKHWVDHVQLEQALENTQDGLKHLFDPRAPHLKVWVWISDPDDPWDRSPRSKSPSQPRGSCLHYAALFGFHRLISFLAIECSQDVNATDLDYNRTPLHVALRYGHIKFARILIEYGADANAQDYYKATPLHLALKGGYVEFAQLLVGHGADMNAQDNHKSTPLHLALQGGHEDFARVLVHHGVDVNTQDNHKSTPLHLALEGSLLEFAQLLIEQGADVNLKDYFKSTPLQLALKVGHLELARVLVEHGADVNVPDYFRSTPLQLTLKGGHVGLARVLIEYGADVNVPDFSRSTPLQLALKGGHVELVRPLVDHGADVNAQDNHKLTPLHLALKGGHVKLARMLVKHGADVNAQTDDKSTPLHLASMGGYVRFARRLVEHGADVNSQDKYKSTPLHIVSQNGQVEFARFLIEHGVDVCASDYFKLTPLHIASRCGHAEFARVLVEHGADVNAQDYCKSTPLHHASKDGHVEFARVLAELHADVNAQDNQKLTPLHIASKSGHVEFAWVLIEYGVDLDARDIHKSTPLHLASQAGHVRLARMLIDHGADVNAEDDDQLTPLHFAAQGGHVELALILIEHGADVNAHDGSGLTPFRRASRREFRDVTQLLLAHGAVNDGE